MKINIKTISELSGFSIATVSNALNGKKGVNAETARKILSIAREYGYASERKLDSITLVAYRDSGKVLSNSPFFATLLESVENESRRNGYETKLVNLYRQSPSFEEEAARRMHQSTSAILLVGTELQPEDAHFFADADVPLVLLDCSISQPAFHAVLMDNEESVHQAAEYLIGLGHQDIGYLRADLHTQNFGERYRGYCRAMVENDLTIREDAIKELPVVVTGARDSFAAWLDTEPQLPTAFLADNDILALGAMQALQEHGIRVPEDVSMIGFDDISFSAISQPGLTTIRVFKKELGQMAVHRLMDLIEEPEQAKACIHVYNEFVLRSSTAAR